MLQVLKSNIIWLVLVLVIKTTTVLFLSGLTRCDHPETMYGIASYTGDAESYIKPYDHLISEGKYYNGNLIAPRTPAVGAVYFLFRMIADKSTALTIQVFLQILLEAAAIVLMARLSEKLTGKKFAFYFCAALMTASTWTTFYSYQILSESFSISILCIAVFYYHKYITEDNKRVSLPVVGVLLSLLVFLKPYFGVIYVLIAADLIAQNRRLLRQNFWKSIVRPLFIIALPLVLLVGPWTVRNYVISGKIIPFQEDVYAGLKLDPAAMSVRTFLESIGESSVFWDTKSAAYYFYNANAPVFNFSNRLYKCGITEEQISDARNLFLRYNSSPDSASKDSVIKVFSAMKYRYVTNDFFGYHIISRMKLAGLYLFHSGSYYLPISKSSTCYSSWHMLIKLVESALYYLILLLGISGLLFFSKSNRIIAGFALITAFLVILFPVILRSPEARYFVPALPLLTVGTVMIFEHIKNWVYTKMLRK